MRTLAAAGQNHTVKHFIHALTEQSIATDNQAVRAFNHQIIKAGNHNLRSASPEQIDGCDRFHFFKAFSKNNQYRWNHTIPLIYSG